MPKYRKKPVEIEALRLCITKETPCKFGVEIPTLEGVMQASIGDYIIKGVAGEFYPCKPEIFAATYELVE